MAPDTIEVLIELLKKPSITPDDQGCQAYIANYLQQAGFSCVDLSINGVSNLWATHGQQGPLIVFCGHTDVVPPGDLSKWNSEPFNPYIQGEKLYARGAADMKSAIAASLTALLRLVAKNPNHPGTIGMMLTSDEEGVAVYGTKHIMQCLAQQNIHIDACIVGEPSCQQFADTIKNGRRGSIKGEINVYGISGHTAYPELAKNPAIDLAKVINFIDASVLDNGDEYFPATTVSIYNIFTHNDTSNVIPGQMGLKFDCRYSAELNEQTIYAKLAAGLDKLNINYTLELRYNNPPFITPDNEFIGLCQQVILQHTGIKAKLSTAGGTSDGRFIAPSGTHVVEFGVCNATIHQANEEVVIKDVHTLSAIYESIFSSYLRVDRD